MEGGGGGGEESCQKSVGSGVVGGGRGVNAGQKEGFYTRQDSISYHIYNKGWALAFFFLVQKVVVLFAKAVLNPLVPGMQNIKFCPPIIGLSFNKNPQTSLIDLNWLFICRGNSTF